MRDTFTKARDMVSARLNTTMETIMRGSGIAALRREKAN